MVDRLTYQMHQLRYRDHRENLDAHLGDLLELPLLLVHLRLRRRRQNRQLQLDEVRRIHPVDHQLDEVRRIHPVFPGHPDEVRRILLVVRRDLQPDDPVHLDGHLADEARQLRCHPVLGHSFLRKMGCCQFVADGAPK
jgi:hypothetical protein